MSNERNTNWCSALEIILFFAGVGHFLHGFVIVPDIISLNHNTRIHLHCPYVYVAFLLIIGTMAFIAKIILKQRKKYAVVIVSLYFVLDIIFLIAYKLMRLNALNTVHIISFLPTLGYAAFSAFNIRYLLLHKEHFME